MGDTFGFEIIKYVSEYFVEVLLKSTLNIKNQLPVKFDIPTIVDPQSSIDFIAELAKVNENAKLTELDGVDHFAVPNMSYLSKEFDLIEWLLAQTK